MVSLSNILGVGIDLVSISEIHDLDKRLDGAFVQKTYTNRELEDAKGLADNYYQFLAGRFAVKEAVYKAICGSFTDIDFDFRQVETIKLKNGAPKFNASETLLEILTNIGASDIKISISNQGDYAIAIAEIIE